MHILLNLALILIEAELTANINCKNHYDCFFSRLSFSHQKSRISHKGCNKVIYKLLSIEITTLPS